MSDLELVEPSGEIAINNIPKAHKHLNPCVRALGPGPEGATCKNCAKLIRVLYRDKVYVKCQMRAVTHGPGTDHRVNWPACKKWEAADI